MLSKNNSIQEIFSRLSGKYRIKRIIDNHGYGEGVAYFLPENLNELLYTEELKLHYHDCNYQIPAIKEYRYILENDNIVKYFTGAENNLFYRLDFIQLTLDRFRQNEFKGELVQRIKIREHRRMPQNSLVSSDQDDAEDNSKAIGSHLCGKDGAVSLSVEIGRVGYINNNIIYQE